MNARYMDPNVGVFITPDPAMSGLNHYNYCSANPVNYTDPTGLDMIDLDPNSGWHGSSGDGSISFTLFSTSWVTNNNKSTTNNNVKGTTSTFNFDLPKSYDEIINNNTNNILSNPISVSSGQDDQNNIVNNSLTINANVDPGKAAFFGQETLFPTIFIRLKNNKTLNVACLGTEIINAMSIQYTKLTGKVLTEDLAKKMANATIKNGSITAERGVEYIQKFIDTAWGVLENDKNIFWGQNKTGNLTGSWATGGGSYHIGLGDRYNSTGEGFYHWELILSKSSTVDSWIGGLNTNSSINWTRDINIGFIRGK